MTSFEAWLNQSYPIVGTVFALVASQYSDEDNEAIPDFRIVQCVGFGLVSGRHMLRFRYPSNGTMSCVAALAGDETPSIDNLRIDSWLYRVLGRPDETLVQHTRAQNDVPNGMYLDDLGDLREVTHGFDFDPEVVVPYQEWPPYVEDEAPVLVRQRVERARSVEQPTTRSVADRPRSPRVFGQWNLRGTYPE